MKLLIDEPYMCYVRNSLNNVDPGNVQFCRDIVNFIDISSVTSDDRYFFDMTPFIRFQVLPENGVACTDPNGLIMMNPPHQFKSLPEWDFIYDHECLHQLWETFKVADKIVAKHGDYDHEILNIASDCVINDYLDFYRNKKIPGGRNGGLVTPEKIQKEFGVTYERSKDTQYTLYMKIIKAIKSDPKLKDKWRNFKKLEPKQITYRPPGPTTPPIPGGKIPKEYIRGWVDGIKDATSGKVDPLKYKPNPPKDLYEEGYNDVMEEIKAGLENGIEVSKGGSTSSGSNELPPIPWNLPPDNSKGGKGGKGGDPDSTDAKESAQNAEESARRAKQEANRAEQAARKAKGSSSGGNSEKVERSAQRAREAADKAEQAAKKAKEAARRGDFEEASKQEEIAEQAAREAAANADVAEGRANNQQQGNNPGGKGNSPGEYSGYVENPDDLSKMEEKELANGTIRKQRDTIVGRYMGSNSGDFGKFVRQCRFSKEMRESGLAIEVPKSKANWAQVVYRDMSAYISQMVMMHNMEYERTYSRFKRGSMVPRMGDPLLKGKQVKEDKFPISVAFWVDCSGSMGNGKGSKLYNATKCMYRLADDIVKEWNNEASISEFTFEFYSWDTSIYSLRRGEMPSSGGSTMSLDQLLKGMLDRKNSSTINIVITDGQGGLSTAGFNRYIRDLEGIIIFVASETTYDVMKHANACDQLSYVQATSDFTLD